jgi:ABC-type phosphate transport system auxiliary subunit
MPVTVKLSRLFYERFGDEIANELADWLNHVDAAATRQLRDLNTQNFRQFEAVLNARAREIEARIEGLGSAMDVKLEGLRSEIDVKLEGLRTEIDIKLEGLSAKFERRLAENKEELKTEISALRTDLHAFKAELLKWMFLFWLGSVATILSFGNLLWGG